MTLRVTFSPDHASDLYADVMRIALLSLEKNSRVVQLCGRSRKRPMYIRGVEPLTANLNTESMMLADTDDAIAAAAAGALAPATGPPAQANDDIDGVGKELPIPVPVMLTFTSVPVMKSSVCDFSQSEKIIYIGCMRSGAGDKKETKKVR